ncbi:MAG: hypothetical protein ACM3NQ_09435 [Bacteroidales bacterium]
MKLAVSVLVLAIALAGCGKQRVVTEPDVPRLAPPAPPPRVVTPPEPEEPAPAAKPAEAPASKPSRQPARVVEPPRETPKPEVPPLPAKPEVTAPAQQALQTQLPVSQEETEKQIRALNDKAKTDLKNVTYQTLSKDAKGQYDQAQRFTKQADQALHERNYVLAQRLAEKAATIAGVLLGR